MPPPADPTVDVAARIVAEARHDATYVVSIDGPSGSGKTSFAHALRAQVAAYRSVGLLAVDEFVPGWEGLAAVVPVLEQILGAVKGGRTPRARLWDWHAGRPGDWAPFEWARPPRCDVLLVDGCASGSRSLAAYVDLLIWLDAPEATRHARAIGRDGEAYAPWWDMWSRQERALYAREHTAARADLRMELPAGGWRIQRSGS